MSVKQNLNLPVYRRNSNIGFVDQKNEKTAAQLYIENLHIKTPTADTLVDTLSGGNKQKVCIGKWLNADAAIIIFDEPTKGIDLGAKNEIYGLMRQLADEGRAILFISSELPEILNISDRIIVFKDGHITKEFEEVSDLTEYDVFQYAIAV